LPSLLQGSVVGSCSAWCPPEPPSSFLQTCFPDGATHSIHNNIKKTKEITTEKEAKNKQITITYNHYSVFAYSQQGQQDHIQICEIKEAYICA